MYIYNGHNKIIHNIINTIYNVIIYKIIHSMPCFHLLFHIVILLYGIIIIILFKVQCPIPMYIEVRVQWTKSQNTFTVIYSDHNINNNIINNTNIVVYSQHPHCCVNNIVLTLFLK